MRRRVLVVADDLTGACDAAVHFAACGLATVVTLAGEPFEGAVEAVSTDSRDVETAEIQRRLEQVARARASRGAIVFKKIDSTLRGLVGAELALAREVFQLPAVVLTPAYPALGREVRNGWLRVTVDPVFEPVDVAKRLRGQGLADCRSVSLDGVQAALESGARALAVDAASAADLLRLAGVLARWPAPLLWAGSGGLAAALARELAQPALTRPRGPGGALLFGIGSNHAATLRQREELLRTRDMACFSALDAAPEALQAALRAGRHVWLEIPHAQVPAERLRRLIEGAPAAALVLSGGDTAAAVCAALGTQSIELCDEIVAGLPRGTLHGGAADRMAVVTKSGGFGSAGALTEVVDYFA